MESLNLQVDTPRNPIGQILTHEGRSLALVDLGRDASKALRASWSTDQPSQSGGAIDSSWLLPMLGAGSTGASSLMAGSVFLATANPATLMTIGTGVGTAVMGSGRNRRAGAAEDYARFETAAERIDEIRSEFEHARRFASDVPDRLARIDHDMGVLRSKYGLLMTGAVDSEDGARAAVSDLNRFFLASLYDIQIDVLQLHLALQNDPDVVEFRQSRLREKLERYGEGFRQVLHDDRVGAYHRELKGGLARSRLVRLPGGLRLPFGGEPAAQVRRVRAIRKDFDAGQRRVQQWVEALEAATDESRRESVVFYREAGGERALRAYRTGEVRVEGVGG